MSHALPTFTPFTRPFKLGRHFIVLSALATWLGVVHPTQAARTESASVASERALLAHDAAFSLPRIERRSLPGGLAAYRFVVRQSSGGDVVIHRIVREHHAGRPQPTPHAVMLLHGDFSTFASNFALPLLDPEADPQASLALSLARQNIDVWGVDRRYTQLADGSEELPALAEQGIARGLADLQAALALARGIRFVTNLAWQPFKVIGFSRGGLYAYAHAITDASRPRSRRHVDGIAVLDINYVYGDEHAADRAQACEWRQLYDDAMALGYTAESNIEFRQSAQAALTDPNGPSPNNSAQTNRQAFLGAMARTYEFFAPTPHYHLFAAADASNVVNDLAFADPSTAARWVAQAPGWSAAREVRDSLAIWCDDGSSPVPGTLADIDVPVLHVAAAGGYGDLMPATVDAIELADSDLLLWQKKEPADRELDVGHADLLFSPSARSEVWPAIVAWIVTN